MHKVRRALPPEQASSKPGVRSPKVVHWAVYMLVGIVFLVVSVRSGCGPPPSCGQAPTTTGAECALPGSTRPGSIRPTIAGASVCHSRGVAYVLKLRGGSSGSGGAKRKRKHDSSPDTHPGAAHTMGTPAEPSTDALAAKRPRTKRKLAVASAAAVANERDETDNDGEDMQAEERGYASRGESGEEAERDSGGDKTDDTNGNDEGGRDEEELAEASNDGSGVHDGDYLEQETSKKRCVDVTRSMG